MVEMLVVVCLLLLLGAILWGAVSITRTGGPGRNIVSKHVHDICSAAEAYQMMLQSYPPGTGQVDPATGTTTPFAPGEMAEPNAVCRYLGTQLTLQGSPPGRNGSFLIIHPRFIRTVNGLQIMVDQWGNPYRMDILKDPANPQRVLVRVWSLGPDGQEGPVPFSRVQTVTDPRDRDNICSWR
jgi:hypothetical protein